MVSALGRLIFAVVARRISRKGTNLEKRLISSATKDTKFPTKWPIPGINHILLVASGKGGVGKSTTAGIAPLRITSIPSQSKR